MVDKKPELGKNPFLAEIAANALKSGYSTVYGKGASNPRDLDNNWFTQQSAIAKAAIQKIPTVPGFMELRFLPETLTEKSPRELLSAVEQSEIKTFGWPIGVTLQNRDEYRPRPSEEGIKAEISVFESDWSGRTSYDYWSLTRGGDFYLLQSLFEDSRGRNKLFFNTRIVRVAEALLFAERLYQNLGLPLDTRIRVRVAHDGLKGRELSSSSPNRLIFQKRFTMANHSEQNLEVEVGSIKSRAPELTRLICAPMFELFDFAEFGSSIYDEIVGEFIAGRVT